MGFIFCGKNPLHMTRIHVSDPGRMDPVVVVVVVVCWFCWGFFKNMVTNFVKRRFSVKLSRFVLNFFLMS